MRASDRAEGWAEPGEEPGVAALIPLVRRAVFARVSDRSVAEDLVQETLVRVLAAAERIADGMLEPYALATARNLVASMWKQQDRLRRNQHRVLDLAPMAPLDENLLRTEERDAISVALGRLADRERQTLLEHELTGRDTRSLGQDLGLTPGAVAAQLNRTRARLRVEYLLALQDVEPPTPRCRPVLFALSSGDRRRQREVEAAQHLLGCPLCASLSEPLLHRGQRQDSGVATVTIESEPDVVEARKRAREVAATLGFTRTDLTLIATAVSELARNILLFAGSGEVVISSVRQANPQQPQQLQPRVGVRVVARDSGPGIADVNEAMQDGYSTSQGLGMGLPGARRLMDEFEVVSEVGSGTTVTMTKWLKEGR